MIPLNKLRPESCSLSPIMLLSQIKNFVIESVIPSYCYGCKKENTYLCEDCFEIINSFSKSICPHCKQALPFGKLPDTCRHELSLNRIFSCADYKDVRIKKLIKDLKYNYSFALAKPLAEFGYWWLQKNEYTDEIKNNVSLIVSVPLHKNKLKKRGFNHAEYLARHFGKLLDIPVANNFLIKTRPTIPQVETKTKEERQENLKNAFSTIGTPGVPIVSTNVLLIDDVLTTGSTLRECAKVLRKNGVKEVWALTIAQD